MGAKKAGSRETLDCGVVKFVRVTTNKFNLGKCEIFRHHTIMQRGSFFHPVDIKRISVFVRETSCASIS